MKVIRTYVSRGEAVAAGYRSLISAVLLFFAASGVGLVLGEWISWGDLSLRVANPLTWFQYVCHACTDTWGILFFLLTLASLHLFVFSPLPVKALFPATVALQTLLVLVVNKDWPVPSWAHLGIAVVYLGGAVLIGYLVWRVWWSRRLARPGQRAEQVSSEPAPSDEPSA